jgi:hypothetical protein
MPCMRMSPEQQIRLATWSDAFSVVLPIQTCPAQRSWPTITIGAQRTTCPRRLCGMYGCW